MYSIVFRPLLSASGAGYFGVLVGIPGEFALVGEVPVEGVPVEGIPVGV